MMDVSKLAEGPTKEPMRKRYPGVTLSSASEEKVQTIMAAFGWDTRAHVVNMMIEAAFPATVEAMKKQGIDVAGITAKIQDKLWKTPAPAPAKTPAGTESGPASAQ